MYAVGEVIAKMENKLWAYVTNYEFYVVYFYFVAKSKCFKQKIRRYNSILTNK